MFVLGNILVHFYAFSNFTFTMYSINKEEYDFKRWEFINLWKDPIFFRVLSMMVNI